MHDARAMGSHQCFGALRSEIEERLQRDRPRQTLAQSLPFDELHDKEGLSILLVAVLLKDVINGSNMGIAQAAGIFRLFLKAAAVERIVSERRCEALERDGAFQPGIEGAVNLAHAAPANAAFNTKTARHQGMKELGCWIIVGNPGGRLGHNRDVTRLVAL